MPCNSAEWAARRSISPASTLLAAECRSGLAFQSELLELPQQPLLALAHLGDERLGRIAVQREAHPCACSRTHLDSSHGLTVICATTCPPARLTASWSAAGAFARASSRANRASVVSGGIWAIAGAQMLLHVRLAPTLHALDEDYATRLPAHRQRHRCERLRHRRGRSGLALEQFDVARATPLSFRERAQTRPALGDRAVIVAVDQVCGLQLCHLAHDQVDELARDDDLLDDLPARPRAPARWARAGRAP